MQVRRVQIQNFRGIKSLVWQPTTTLTCVLGPGDSGKSTLLDAIEMALSPRWIPFSDVDFTAGDPSQPIEIFVTVGDLPPEALREPRMGSHVRGWSATGLRDEPDGEDEPVITVRMSVDSSLEPAWELVTQRGEPKTLSPRDRALFGMVRLGGDIERHLTWGQGSALSRLGNDKQNTTPLLADAYRRARVLLAEGTLPTLDGIAAKVREHAVQLGAYAHKTFSAGLDTQRSSMSLGSLAIHGNGIPLRLAGLGTRRLVALAIQQMAIPEGAILLIDEIEHGLEPHRIRHALKVLRSTLSGSGAARAGQVILTTHSTTSIVELGCERLAICRRTEAATELRSPSPLLQALVRRAPEAFLSRRVLVCEGKTEVGMLRTIRDFWAARHDGEPLEARGVVLADGNGTEAVATARALGQLGYCTALLRDSDVQLTPQEASDLAALAVPVFEWEGGLATEERLLRDLSVAGVQAVLDAAYEYYGEESVLDCVRSSLVVKDKLDALFSEWTIEGKTQLDFRKAIGQAAKRKDWFKRIEPGERLGVILTAELTVSDDSSMSRTLNAVETWAYG